MLTRMPLCVAVVQVRHSEDFAGMSEEQAMDDLRARIVHYEKIYQPVREEEGPFIKMYDLKAKANCCNIYGRMANKVLPFLLATHGIRRPIFLAVLPSGDEAEASMPHRKALLAWAAKYERRAELKILASTAPRARASAELVADATGGPRPESRPNLAPLAARSDLPREPALPPTPTGTSSFVEKFGEPVHDLVARLEPIVVELEGAVTPVLVIAQEAHCRTLRAYLLKAKVAEMTHRDAIDPSLTHRDAQPQLIEFVDDGAGGVEERQKPLIAGDRVGLGWW